MLASHEPQKELEGAVHADNSNTRESETGNSLGLARQPISELQAQQETLSHKNKAESDRGRHLTWTYDLHAYSYTHTHTTYTCTQIKKKERERERPTKAFCTPIMHWAPQIGSEERQGTCIGWILKCIRTKKRSLETF